MGVFQYEKKDPTYYERTGTSAFRSQVLWIGGRNEQHENFNHSLNGL